MVREDVRKLSGRNWTVAAQDRGRWRHLLWGGRGPPTTAMIKKWGLRTWTGFFCFRKELMAGSCECGDETSGPVNGRVF